MKPIKEYMTELPHTVGEGTTLDKAHEFMHEYNCHHLPVLDGGKLVGVISSRDLQLSRNIGSSHTHVRDIMAEEPFIVAPNTSLKEVVSTMHQKGVGSAIVSAQENQNWGIFTISDALRVLSQLL